LQIKARPPGFRGSVCAASYRKRFSVPRHGGEASNLLAIREGALSEHKFKIGQAVHFTSGPYGRGGVSGVFKVVQLLPPEGDDRQYRIKSASEPHERVVKESQLNRAS
jgi:hypothetical protein